MRLKVISLIAICSAFSASALAQSYTPPSVVRGQIVNPGVTPVPKTTWGVIESGGFPTGANTVPGNGLSVGHGATADFGKVPDPAAPADPRGSAEAPAVVVTEPN
jgi:hypothetical protein